MEKLEGNIKRSVCISKRGFMLKYYPLSQHYAQFLIVPIMLAWIFDVGLVAKLSLIISYIVS